MWLLLLPQCDNFRNARLHLRKCHSHIIFATKFVPFLRFDVYQHRKDCSQRYVVTNGMRISRDSLAIRGYAAIWRHQNVESFVVLKSCCWTWLSCSPMISSRYSSFTSAVATLNVNGCLTHAGYAILVGKYPSRDFASSSKCIAIACFSSLGTEMSPVPDTSSILLTQSSNRGKTVEPQKTTHRTPGVRSNPG